MRRWLAAALLIVSAAVVMIGVRRGGDGEARAQTKASFDSLAPAGAPAHWLPPEDWVYNHWLPYDEGRLYALLGVTRGDIWRHLRDDRHTIAELAAAHGWKQPKKLAAALVEPLRAQVPAAMLPVLRERAERTLTQGHLSQHLLFHSLHQFAIPSEAPLIFGLTDADFRGLRREEQSPLDIGRANGRSPAEIQALSASVLREQVRAGVRSGAMPEAQGRLLLGRQLAQLPRWLSQARYNGPPPTHDGKLVRLPRNYAANPAVSADGRHVTFEAYQQQLKLALQQGEISVQTRSAGAGAPVPVSRVDAARRGPQSSYNPSVSADGRFVAFESAEGNRNFAKRYGAIRVFVRDARSGVQRQVRPSEGRFSRSAFNPAISADGSAVAYQAVLPSGRTQVLVTQLASRRTVLVSRRGRSGPAADADTYEPSISADGRRVAFTSAARNLGAGGHRSQVFVRDLERGTTTKVSDGAGAASSPALSGDGRHVAFVEGHSGGRTRIRLHDLRSGATVAVSGRADGIALRPAVSANGRFVAYAAVAGGRSTVMLRDLRRPRAVVVSRADGRDGAPADDDAVDPSLSADGRKVAFASTATNLAAGKPDDRRGVFLRDVRRGTTALVSAPVPPPSDAPKPPLAPAVDDLPAGKPLTERRVAILDNAFNRGRDRPVAHLRAGQRLTWLWRSRQSHQVTVGSGPMQLSSPTKAHGRFSARLTEPGRYTFVCSIHAPGMRMTAVVR